MIFVRRTLAQRCALCLLLLSVGLLCAPLPARAQAAPVNEESGRQPNRDYLTLQPWEAIDTASGNVLLTFTDLELPGNNGRALKFQRTFNNTLNAPEPATQWRFSISDVPMRVTTPTIPVGASIVNTVVGEQNWTPRFFMSDGSTVGTNFMYDPNTSSGQLTATTRWVSTSSFWRYDRIDRYLMLPDGRSAQYDSQGRLTAIYDRFSNAVTLTWGTNSLSVVQSLGNGQSRQVDLVMDDAVGLPVRMSFEGKDWHYIPDPYFPGKLVTVVPPTGGQWNYQYESPTLVSNMKTVTTPQGGTVTYSYDWETFVFSPTHTDYIRALVGRTADSRSVSGTWSFHYLITGPNGALGGMIARPPASAAAPARRIEYGYSPSDAYAVAGGWQLTSVTVYEGESSTVVEQEMRDYTPIPAVRSNRVWHVPELRMRRFTRGGRVYETESVYNLSDTINFANFHRPSQVIERTAGEVRRVTNIWYQHLTSGSPYVVGLPTIEEMSVDGDRSVRGWTYSSATGFRTSETAQGNVTTFTPDGLGNVQRITKGNGKWTEYSYSYGQVATTTSSEPGYSITRDINPNGTVHYDSQAGRSITYQYDDLLRVTVAQRSGGVDQIQTSYSDTSTGQTITVQRGSSVSTTTTDGFGRVLQTLNGASVRTTSTFDSEGRLTRASLPFVGSPGGSTDKGTTFTYDAVGRVLRETNADASYTQRTYGADAVTVRDENGHETLLTYRTFGHPDDRQLVGVRDAEGQQWTYRYNVLGGMRDVLSPDGVARTWTYDSETHRLLNETHPESGTVAYTSYDGAGILKERRDANGMVFTYEHDGNDRVTQISAGGRVTTITYEPGSDNRQSAVVGSTETRFYYDGAGRLRARDDTVDGRTYSRRFEYDGRDNLALVTYPSGRHISYGFDSENRITSVFDQTANRSVADNFNYHPSGAVASYRAGNNLTTTISYNANRYWVDAITVGQLQLGYSYDPVGNVSGITDSRSNHNQTFSYDPLDRLEVATSSVMGPSSFAYDVHGNRLGSGYEYWPDTLRLRTQGTRSFDYDNNGNLKTVNTNARFNYSPDNMMSDATVDGVTTVYEYDADQWRVRKSGGTTTSHYLRGASGELLTEVADAGLGTLELRDYVYAGPRLLSMVTTTAAGGLCPAVISPTSASLVQAGGPQTVSVSVGPSCAWQATSALPWVTVTSGGTGTGNGTVTLNVELNDTGLARDAVITIAGRPFTVSQAGGQGPVGLNLGPTLYAGQRMTPDSYLQSTNGLYQFKYFASGQLVLLGPAGAIWPNGSTPGAAYAELLADGRFVVYKPNGTIDWWRGAIGNPGSQLEMQNDRNVVLYNAEGQVTWTTATQCVYAIAPSNIIVPSHGSTGSVTISTTADCPHPATSSDSWLTITSGTTGMGDATLTFTVDRNDSTDGRIATIDISGTLVTVRQAGTAGNIGERLYPGQKMWPGQTLTSANGEFHIGLFDSGVLSLWGQGGELWRTGTTSGFGWAEMSGNGQIVGYASNGVAAWWVGSAGHPNAFLLVHDNGRAMIYDAGGTTVLWQEPTGPPCTYEVWPPALSHGPNAASGAVTVATQDLCTWVASTSGSWITFTSSTSGTSTAVVSYVLADNPSTSERSATITVAGRTISLTQGGQSVGTTDRLLPGDQIHAGQSLVSEDGRFELFFQGDGNLVLYRSSEVLWTSNTDGKDPGFLVMQGDGNLVAYTSFGSPIFNTGTAGYPGAWLVLQNDGNLVLYDAQGSARWWTGTGGH